MNPIQKLPARAFREFSAARKEEFLEHWRASGCLYLSCAAVGISERTVQDHRKRDPEFAERYLAAEREHIEEFIYKPALERAAQGKKRPIIGGKERDTVVAYETIYSDGLMSQILKAKLPEFREGAKAGESGGASVSGFMAPPKPMTHEEWYARYAQAAKGSKPE
jgi:hypothetical protein